MKRATKGRKLWKEAGDERKAASNGRKAATERWKGRPQAMEEKKQRIIRKQVGPLNMCPSCRLNMCPIHTIYLPILLQKTVTKFPEPQPVMPAFAPQTPAWQPPATQMQATVPMGVYGGQMIQVNTPSGRMQVRVPMGLGPGMQFTFAAPPAQPRPMQQPQMMLQQPQMMIQQQQVTQQTTIIQQQGGMSPMMGGMIGLGAGMMGGMLMSGALNGQFSDRSDFWDA